MFEGVAGPPSYVAMALPLSGRRARRGDGELPPARQLGLMVERQLARVGARARRPAA